MGGETFFDLVIHAVFLESVLDPLFAFDAATAAAKYLCKGATNDAIIVWATTEDNLLSFGQIVKRFFSFFLFTILLLLCIFGVANCLRLLLLLSIES